MKVEAISTSDAESNQDRTQESMEAEEAAAHMEHIEIEVEPVEEAAPGEEESPVEGAE